MNRFLICLLGCILLSCQGDFGYQGMKDQLTVFYVNKNDEELAKAIAVYWKENNLMTEEKQYLRLVRSTNNVDLQLIANNPNQVRNMPFDEMKLFHELLKDLRDETNSPNLRIVITNGEFKSLYQIDE